MYFFNISNTKKMNLINASHNLMCIWITQGSCQNAHLIDLGGRAEILHY